MGSYLKGKNLLLGGSKLFPLSVDHSLKGRGNENIIVASTESIAIHFKV